MKTLKYLALIAGSIIIWTACIFYGGLINGFLLKPINEANTNASFIAASQEKINKEFVGNLAMTIIEDGKVSETHYHSIDQPMNDTIVFQVASVSKWVTSWGIMRLVQEGRLDLDTPVDNYLTRWHLPKSDFDNEEVTIRRLLSHTSGLTDDLGYDGFGPNDPVQTIEESLTKAADAMYADGVAKVGYKPGSRYMYSGAGYTILQLIIEEVSGLSFQEYMKQRILEPLGMRHSTFVLSDMPHLRLATLYNDDGTIAQPSKFTALAAASLFTCTKDLSMFLMANVSENPVLRQETIQQMIVPEAYINTTPVYGMGPHLYSQLKDDSNIIGHDGSSGSPVINTAARIDLLSKNGLIILEMGSHNIASNLADEWMFWKAGIADYVVLQRNKTYLISLLVIGYLVIALFFIVMIRRKNSLNGKS